jgi:uncharacterized protein (TIGR02117 family)
VVRPNPWRLFIVYYFVFNSVFALSRIGVPKEINSYPASIPIYILTDGVHTDIVLPSGNAIIDWRKLINTSNDTTMRFVAFGWGDKNFYINTPTWTQLKFSTAFKAVFGLSTSAIHTAFYKGLRPGPYCKMIELNNVQYRRLVDFIRSSFKIDGASNFIHIKTNVAYGYNDAFFDANGRYSLFYTCNTWANNALKSCGQRACLWTIFANGIAYQYRDN